MGSRSGASAYGRIGLTPVSHSALRRLDHCEVYTNAVADPLWVLCVVCSRGSGCLGRSEGRRAVQYRFVDLAGETGLATVP